MISKAIGYVMLAFVVNTLMAFLGLQMTLLLALINVIAVSIPYALSRFVVTGMRATISSTLVEQDEQGLFVKAPITSNNNSNAGRAFALCGIVQSLAHILSAPIFNELMVQTTHTRLPGIAFLIFAAALMLTSAMLLLVVVSLLVTISTLFSIVHRLIEASDHMRIDEEASDERQSLAT